MTASTETRAMRPLSTRNTLLGCFDGPEVSNRPLTDALQLATFFSRTPGRPIDAAAGLGIIWLQTYRMAGLMFLFPFLYYGIVPAAFAIPAGLGDFVTGALAPLVALAVARQRPTRSTGPWRGTYLACWI